MSSIARPAAKDYNSNIASIQANSEREKQNTIVSVVEQGGNVRRVVTNSTVSALKPLNENAYDTSGGSTPLFDSVIDLISQFERVPDASDKDVSFLVMAVTDGEDNASRTTGRQLAQKIAQLQSTDHWTFVFRVPMSTYGRNYKQALVNLGIPEGNILEWEQTQRGVEIAARATEQAYSNYFSARQRTQLHQRCLPTLT